MSCGRLRICSAAPHPDGQGLCWRASGARVGTVCEAAFGLGILSGGANIAASPLTTAGQSGDLRAWGIGRVDLPMPSEQCEDGAWATSCWLICTERLGILSGVSPFPAGQREPTEPRTEPDGA